MNKQEIEIKTRNLIVLEKFDREWDNLFENGEEQANVVLNYLSFKIIHDRDFRFLILKHASYMPFEIAFMANALEKADLFDEMTGAKIKLGGAQ